LLEGEPNASPTLATPLLDDSAIQPIAQPPLLDIDSIFADDVAPRTRRPNYSRELLIQELVDELVPQLEAALHKRLDALDNDALLALALKSAD
jgi:hypothetical protein